MAANASPPRELRRPRARGLGRPRANETAPGPGEEARLEQITAFRVRFGARARHGLMPGSVAISAGSSRYSMSSYVSTPMIGSATVPLVARVNAVE
jgi:hypothetical protein